ncbi:MAG: phenylacetate--CoA ligase [Anaerolineales bacterium]|nr:phenylacetate--CoA ligase [Anaerolineales bacterium]MCB0008018.1 phenylacetate--CoA ligase [Anaerolineales bacterium]MCB8962670.1 phenylacetate--CoA ligase [Ardenticatenales bacterium]
MIWNEAVETMPRADLEALQVDRLAKLVRYLYERVTLYRQRLDALGTDPASIKSLADLTRLPFTYKSDLRDHYPFGMFATPMNEVVRLHASSGTTGKPTVVGYTREDLGVWAEVVARCFGMSGAVPGDIFQNAYGYGLFTGGLGMHVGAELMGLNTIPVSGGNTARQILLLQDFGTNIMACTPSYALTLADALQSAGIDPADLPVRSFILGAEPWTEEMRKEVEAKLKADAVNIYGLSEIIGPGVANECVEAKDGMHIMEDHFLAEIVNPETGDVLPAGQVGELVLTTLTKQAIPLLRYRTGDLCSINYEPCVCGRTHARMSRVLGRADDMLIIRGVNVFPTQIEAALLPLPETSPHYRLIVTRENRLDTLHVQSEVTPAYFAAIGASEFPTSTAVQQLAAQIQGILRDALGLNTTVEMVAPGEAPRSEGGKIKRIEDRRSL